MSDLDKAINNFSKCCNELIKKYESHNLNEKEKTYIDRIKRFLRLCPKEEKIIRSKDRIWFFKDDILSRNSEKLFNADFSQVTDQVELLDELVAVIKKKYDVISNEERNEYWIILTKMLQAVIEYKQINKEYV